MRPLTTYILTFALDLIVIIVRVFFNVTMRPDDYTKFGDDHYQLYRFLRSSYSPQEMLNMVVSAPLPSYESRYQAGARCPTTILLICGNACSLIIALYT